MSSSWTVTAETLAGIRIFATLDAQSRARIAARCHAHRTVADEVVVHYGDTSRDVFFVVSGRARATIYSRTGKEVAFRDMGAGELFGDLSAIDGRARSATVVALEPSLLFAMTADDFRDVLRTYPEVADHVMCDLVRLVRLLSDRVVEFGTLGVKNRIHAELLRLARACTDDGLTAAIAPAPTHAEIASRVATHREAVTRELKALGRAGLIAKQGRTLRVSDLPRLERMVRDVKGN